MSKVVLNLGLSKKPSTNKTKTVLQSDNDDGPSKVKVDFIKSVDGKEIDPEKKTPPVFTIPLTQNPWEKSVPETAEDEAVAAILGEAAQTDVEKVEKRVAPIVGPAVQSGPTRPILQAAMIPGLEELKDETEKFKHDIAVRADDISVNSEIYSNVPITDFGEALLRGMGWEGSRSSATEQPGNQARPSRLGLGAKVRPPSPMGRKKKRSEADQAAADEWAKEAARKVARQVLEVGDIVWLKGREFVTKDDVMRAKVVRTSGVPGLSQIEVELEGSGSIVSVSKKDAILISADELSEKPFVESTKTEKRSSSSSSRSNERSGSSSSQKRMRTDDDSTPSLSSWVMPGIRVRIVRQGKFHREKADIVAVTGSRVVLKLDSGKQVEDISDKDLETVVPSVGDKVRVVRGEHQKRKSIILKKDRDREEVCLEVDGKKLVLRFDDVCARAAD